MAFVRFVAILATAVVALAPRPAAAWFQGFETDIAGWDEFGGQYDAIRVASGTNGITSKTGSWHAQATQADLDNDGGSAFTRFGGATAVFPFGGFTAAIDVWLDVNAGAANDTRLDWSVAAANTAGTHRRDFVLNGGFYDSGDMTGPGAGTNRFIFSASNNAGRSSSYPKNPGRDPFAISSTGWYTLQHVFYDNGAGVLAVDLQILDASATLLHSWTLSDPTDILGVTVGGWRYGWFAAQEFEVLAFDDSRLTLNAAGGPVIPEPGTLALLADGLIAVRRRRRAV